MNILGELNKRTCPVCGGGEELADPFLNGTVDPSRIDKFSFSSRKAPEYMSFRLVRCRGCATVYAAEGPSAEALAGAYEEADYDSSAEASLAAKTYIAALQPHLRPTHPKSRVLEIGTGTGVFLRELLGLGFSELIGVEPSHAAIAAADPGVRPFIREGIFREEGFAPGSLSLICCFQTLEHVPDPRALTQSAFRLLEPGGMIAFVTHDYTSWVNRLLGRRSPIIDLEHMQLFCPTSLHRLLSDAGYDQIVVEGLRNRYPLRYWMRLAPLPSWAKAAANNALSALSLEKAEFGINVGNLLTLGRKPAR